MVRKHIRNKRIHITQLYITHRFFKIQIKKIPLVKV